MKDYRIIVCYQSDKATYLARVPEVSGCQAEGSTRAEAIARVEEELTAQLENMRERGIEPPPPVDQQVFDGELTLKISAGLHRELAFLAAAENVEPETMLVELLARAVSQHWSGGGRGRQPRGEQRYGRPREGQGSRYHEIMENRADFIEYVRSLETGGAPRGGGRGGSGGAGRRGGGRR